MAKDVLRSQKKFPRDWMQHCEERKMGSLGSTKVIHEGRGMGDKGQGMGKGLFLGSTHKLSRDGGGGGQGKKKRWG
jgi:hypothetical protein